MTTYGLTDEGLLVPSATVIREALNAQLQNTFGTSIDVGDKSIIGQFTGIFAAAIASVWEKLEAVNSSQDPDKATGAALDAICSLTGTLRPGASYSTVVLTLTGDAATPVPAGSVARTISTEKGFVTLNSATLEALDAWAPATAYDLEDRVTNGGNAYECITAGTSAGSGGPLTDDEDITDNTAHWIYLGEGAAAADVNARAEETGPTTAVAGDITDVFTSVGGWDGVINLLDATPGRNAANDGELRQLRNDELATGGSTPINALRAELRELSGVEYVNIFVNNTDATDGDGLPPHSIEALVNIPVGGDEDQLVFDTLLAGVAAGIRTHGSGPGAATGTATDDQGNDHVMMFTRPTERNIYIDITVTVDPKLFPADGADQIKQAIVDWGDQQDVGMDARSSAISAQAFNVAGVIDVTACLIDDAPAPASSATIAVSLREIAVYDTSRIDVTANNGTP